MAGYLSLVSVLFIILNNILSTESFAYPDQGKWDFRLDEQNDQVAVVKSLFKESEIRIQITCDSKNDLTKLTISWSLGEVACWKDYLHINEALSRSVPPNDLQRALDNASFYTVRSPPEVHDCDHNIQLKELMIAEDVYTDIQSEAAGVHGMPVDPGDIGSKLKRETREPVDVQGEASEVKPIVSAQQEKVSDQETKVAEHHAHQSASDQHDQRQVLKQIHTQPSSRPVMKVTKDGYYMLSLQVSSNAPFSADVHIEMKGKHGYLSAADWPLLPFYGAMCLVYVVLGLAWLIVSFLQWRDLLRIQFWIGGVILLGMLEKAMFYAEYQSINTTGESGQTAVLVAELVSCGKRTLARMLVIIVSLGFGIVKPRLGPMLHRTVATGILYFLLAGCEAYLRVMRPKSDPANQMLVASVPLAVLDSAICWWIFTSLVQTTRTLRLRRNMVKLNLYRHFTNTLIFAVISSVVFMLYSIKAHYLVNCFTAWKELWIDDAYWKLLFSVILLVIMILWRPTNNNQRYAFTPLLDAPEDGDDEEEEYFVSDAYGVKMRGGLNSGTSSPKQKLSMNTAEEDLKWVEENIPTSLADSALPILDSDEEIMNTKFELSKMQ